MKFNINNLFSNYKYIFHDNRKMKEFLLASLTLKRFMTFCSVTYFIGIYYAIINYNKNNYNISFTRYISRKAGQIGEITIPQSMRGFIYRRYMKIYNVDEEEILDGDLKNYKTIKEFFIRKIKLDKRPIENESSEVLSSPCDGKILSISEVTNFQDLIIVKGRKYSIAEFLFGDKWQNDPTMGDLLIDLKKKFYQITIYLSPGDCHRFYSPNNITVNKRIYIPGFLEPVRPSYLNKHPDVLLTNERVTLKCEQEGSDNHLFITYVGALNVGSINLLFDDFLKTNIKLYEEEANNSGFFILNYSDILIPGNSKLERKNNYFYKPKFPLLMQEIDKDTEEWDVRDMVDIDFDFIKKFKIDLNEVTIPLKNLKEKLLYENTIRGEENLKFNFSNSFLTANLDILKKKNLLANPKQLAIENFKVSNRGVHLNKKDEMGWFNFGSTIVLIFSVENDKQIKFNFDSGNTVKIGQTLFEYNKI